MSNGEFGYYPLALSGTEVRVKGTITVVDGDGDIQGTSKIMDPDRQARGRYGKIKGAENERRVMRKLVEHGYHCCKSSASLGAFDIVAFNAKHLLCIQVKSSSMPPPAERAAMLAVPIPPNGYRLIWRWRPRGAYLLTELLAGDVQRPYSLT